MFDLFRSQQKAVRILLTVLLGMVALSMLVYLIPGAGSPMGNRNDQIVAEIGKQVLTVHDVEMDIQRAMRGRQLPPDLVQAVIPQRIEELTAERALAYEAQRLGFQITDKDLADNIRSLAPQIASLTPQQYRDYIEQQIGESVAEFEGNMRLGLYGNALEQVATEGAIATPEEVEAEYKRRNDKIKLDYLGFDPAKLTAEVKPTPQDLKAYFDKNKGFFTVPESRTVQLIIADQSKVSEAIPITDAQVQSYYNTHKDDFRTPERVKARHILVMTQDKPKDQVDKLRAKAEDLLKQVKAGADFAKLAEKNSDDTASAKNGGDLGWVVHGQMVPEFEKATFALKPGETSGIITTQYGFHIIQVLERESARLRPVDEVKADITKTLRNQMVADRMQNLADQARAELMKAPQTAQQIATKLGLEFVNIDKFKQGDPIPQAGTDPQIGAAIMSLQKGAVSEVLQAQDKLTVATVTSITPPHPPEFSEVEAQIRTKFQQEKANTLASDRAKKAADMLKANGGDLKAVAKSMGMEMKSTDFFSRNGAAEGIGSGSYLGEAFDKPVGTQIGPLNVGTQTVVAKIVDKTQADMSKLAEQRDTIVTQLKSKRRNERQALLRDSILTMLIQQGKVKIHKDVVNRLVARYRS